MKWLCNFWHKWSPWMSVWGDPERYIFNYFAANDNFAGYTSFLFYERWCNRCHMKERVDDYRLVKK